MDPEDIDLSFEQEQIEAKEKRNKFRNRWEAISLAFTLAFASPILYLFLKKPIVKLTRDDIGEVLLITILCITGGLASGMASVFWLLKTREGVFTKKRLRYRWVGLLGGLCALALALAGIYYVKEVIVKFD